MPFSLSAPVAADQFRSLMSGAQNATSACAALQMAVPTGAVPADRVLNLMLQAQGLLALVRSVAESAEATAAITAYYRAQIGNPDFDVAGNIERAVAALTAIIAAIVSEYPKSPDGTLADRTWSDTGSLTFALIPSANLSATLSGITDFLATVG